MKICHCVTIAPNRCGLYGTARDLISAERKVGLDAGAIDCRFPQNEPVINGVLGNYKKYADKEIPSRSYQWAEKADVYVRHSFIPAEFQNNGKPLIMAMHGRPESSYRLEINKTLAAIGTFYKRGADKRYKAFICFWKEYLDIWKTIVPAEKLFYVPAMIDLDYYSPKGKKFDWGDGNGEPNIVIADIWREDIIPFNAIFGAFKFQQKHCPTAKIHIVALQGQHLKAMLPPLKGMLEAGALGKIVPMTHHIRDYYRAADIFVTPHSIATRTVREPLACGVPIVAGTGNKYTPYTANPRDAEGFADAINECWQDYKEDKDALKQAARKTAEIAFNLDNAGEAMKEVLERI